MHTNKLFKAGLGITASIETAAMAPGTGPQGKEQKHPVSEINESERTACD